MVAEPATVTVKRLLEVIAGPAKVLESSLLNAAASSRVIGSN